MLGRPAVVIFVSAPWWDGVMPRHMDRRSPTVLHRTARAGLRLTRGQRRRLTGLLVSAGDVWACVLEVNAWRQAQHEAARIVIGWAVARRIGILAVGDPRGVLNLAAGRRHNRRTRDWRVGYLISTLRDKAQQAGITLVLTDERGTSSACPACRPGFPSPSGGCSVALAAGRPGRPRRYPAHRSRPG